MVDKQQAANSLRVIEGVVKAWLKMTSIEEAKYHVEYNLKRIKDFFKQDGYE